MLEPWRSRYLQAIGVDVYLPRQPLPGAAPSLEPEWDISQIEPASAAAVTVPAPVADRLPPIELESAAPARQQPAAGAAPSAQAHVPRASGRPSGERAQVPRMRLALAGGETCGLLVVADLPAQESRVPWQRLLANLLLALQPGQPPVAADVFDWPPRTRHAQLDLSETAARHTLTGALQRRLEGGAVRGVVVLGERARYWLDAGLRQSLPAELTWRESIGIDAVLADPLRKRQWWQDLAGLAVLH